MEANPLKRDMVVEHVGGRGQITLDDYSLESKQPSETRMPRNGNGIWKHRRNSQTCLASL